MEPHRTVVVERSLLGRNAARAERNRARFTDRGLAVVNVLSSPGSGKTALLARTLGDLAARVRAAVVVGDVATDNDARRLAAAGVEVVQVTTGGVCHLEAGMVARAVERLDLDRLDLLVIENVGNLVCPAAFDLGEHTRVVLLSVTEGEDKPLKYPSAFTGADAVVVTKTDLAAATGFDREAALTSVRKVAPSSALFEVSARAGDGLAPWYAFVEAQVARARRR